MEHKIKFKKKRIFLGIIFFIFMICLSFWFILEPKNFIRNFLMKENYIVLLGLLSLIYFLALLFSFIKLIPRTVALIITDEYFIDNTKYEALGLIRWDEISQIKRIDKRCIQIFFNIDIKQRINKNILKKFLLWSQNWDYKNSIIISSAHIECNIDFLEKEMKKSYKKYHIASKRLQI